MLNLKGLLRCSVLGSVAVVAGAANANSFSDDFSLGLRSQYWSEVNTHPGVYSLDDTHGDVQLTKIANSQAYIQKIGAKLDLTAAVGGPVVGNFSTSVDLSNAVMGSSMADQLELQISFTDGSYFFESYSDEYPQNTTGGRGVHVWNGAYHNGLSLSSNNTGGHMEVTRLGTTVSAYFDGQLVYAESNSAALTGIQFVLQNNLGSNDQTAATYDNFNLTTPVPEPMSIFGLGIGVTTVLLRRRKK